MRHASSAPRLAGGLARRDRALFASPSPRRLFTFIAFASLLCLVQGCVDPAKPPPPQGVLSRYPRSPALDLVAQTHREAASDREGLILLTTWFLDGDPRVAMMCRVRSDGHVSTFRFLNNYSDGAGAIQNTRASDLLPDQFAGLRDAIRDLPPPQNPRLENLVIVSFPRNGQWTTRTYDRVNLLPAVAQLFSTTGAPIDTTQ